MLYSKKTIEDLLIFKIHRGGRLLGVFQAVNCNEKEVHICISELSHSLTCARQRHTNLTSLY